MKKTILFLWLFYVLVGRMNAQVGFRSVYYEEYSAILLDVVVVEDTIVLYGVSRDTFAGPVGIKFVKLDTFGHILSEKTHIDTTTVLTTQLWRQGLIQTKDGGFAIAGSTYDVPGVLYMLKVHSDLSLDFIKMYPYFNVWQGNSAIVEIATGGYMVVGEQLTGSDNQDVVVVRTDADGNQLWRKTYGDDVLQEAVLEIRQDIVHNRFILNGSQDNSHFAQATYGKSYVLIIDSLGNELDTWLSDTSLASINSYSVLSDSSWICASGSWEYDPQYGAYFTQPIVFRMDKDRNVMWKKKIGVLGPDNRLQKILAMPGEFLGNRLYVPSREVPGCAL